MEKISCNVIRDLLPLYCDGVCSPDSLTLVEEHLKKCPECSALLEKMKKECHVAQEVQQEQEEILKDMASTWKKSIFRSFLRGILVTICACLLLVGLYWGATRLILVPVPYNQVQITIENVDDTHVKLHCETIDGKEVRTTSFEYTEDGTAYLVLKRGMLPENSVGNWSGSFGIPRNGNTEDGIAIQITKICYGSPKDHIVIWQAE